MAYLLRRNEDGAYVAPPGSAKSYMKRRDKAQRFPTREAAENNRCGNETIVQED